MAGGNPLFALAVFTAWSVMVAVAAHRRVRNVLLASAGAAGVASGSFALSALLLGGGQDPWLLVAFVFALLFGLVVALLTWVVMKLGGWLPKEGDG